MNAGQDGQRTPADGQRTAGESARAAPRERAEDGAPIRCGPCAPRPQPSPSRPGAADYRGRRGARDRSTCCRPAQSQRVKHLPQKHRPRQATQGARKAETRVLSATFSGLCHRPRQTLSRQPAPLSQSARSPRLPRGGRARAANSSIGRRDPEHLSVAGGRWCSGSLAGE